MCGASRRICAERNRIWIIPCRASFSLEPGFLYPEAVFPVSAKSDVIQLNTIDIFADGVVNYVIDSRRF